jgi:hypothetical protein
MKTKSSYIMVLALLFAMVAFPVYGGSPMGFKTLEGKLTGEIICLYEWTTDQAYQGSNSVCIRPRYGQRSLLTEEGEVFIMVADERASNFVVRALSTDVFEKEVVTVQGEVIDSKPIKIVKVRSLKTK